MGNRGRVTFAKRQREIARQERAREKSAKRVERENTKVKLDRHAADDRAAPRIELALEPAGERADQLWIGLGTAGWRHQAPTQFAKSGFPDFGVIRNGVQHGCVERHAAGSNPGTVAGRAVRAQHAPKLIRAALRQSHLLERMVLFLEIDIFTGRRPVAKDPQPRRMQPHIRQPVRLRGQNRHFDPLGQSKR